MYYCVLYVGCRMLYTPPQRVYIKLYGIRTTYTPHDVCAVAVIVFVN